ncbi:MAG: hypothetical protein WAU23_15010, partial [Ferruginibacter sp.]
LEDAILTLEQRGIEVLLTGLQDQPRLMMERINIIPGLIPKGNSFITFRECVEWLKEHCKP